VRQRKKERERDAWHLFVIVVSGVDALNSITERFSRRDLFSGSSSLALAVAVTHRAQHEQIFVGILAAQNRQLFAETEDGERNGGLFLEFARDRGIFVQEERKT